MNFMLMKKLLDVITQRAYQDYPSRLVKFKKWQKHVSLISLHCLKQGKK